MSTSSHRPIRNVGFSRRSFLEQNALGFGTVALAHLLLADGLLAGPSHAPDSSRRGDDLLPKRPHFAPQAKSVIFLVQNGGPSQVDLFDPKPALQRAHGKRHTEDVDVFHRDERNRLMASPFKFERGGECGMEFSDLVPKLRSVADDLCMVRSMYTDNNNHPQALRSLTTGKFFTGRPSLGAWICYGLGSENQDVPAYVALRDPTGYNTGGTRLWGNGWLPALYRGTEFNSQGAPVLNLHPAVKMLPGVERKNLELLAKLNEERRQLYPDDSRLEARIRNYELAARMQLEAESMLNLSGETEATRRLYGLDDKMTGNYGTRCLMARRLVEAGVRFVTVTSPREGRIAGQPWDNHSHINADIPKIAHRVDRPSAALIKDLKQRGLLDETIVIWAGEFGRLPITEGTTGRDHNPKAFTILLAGGGFKAGHIHGATDEIGYRAVEDRVSCPDFLATVLHQLGLDHDRLSYRHAGREETLTDSAVSGARFVHELVEKPV